MSSPRTNEMPPAELQSPLLKTFWPRFWVWPTAASHRFQKARVANFPTSLSFYSCVTMGRKSSFHSACRVLYCACF